MKMDMSAKPGGEDATDSAAGTYEQGDLECMLEHYIAAKKIEADPALFATLKDYAMSKNKMVAELFDQPQKSVAPKSLSDLKSKYNKLVTSDAKSESKSEDTSSEEASDKED